MKIDRLYEFLANEEDARACSDIDEKACHEVSRNFLLLLLSQFITKLADSCASAKVVLPWLLSSVGAPVFFTGLLVPIRESGSLIPQLLIGGVIRRFAIRKWFFVAGSLAQGLCVLLMAWVGLTQVGTIAGLLIIMLLVIFSCARGVCSVASKDVLGKTVPKKRRGRLNGYSASAAGLLTVMVAAVLFFDVIKSDTHFIALLLLACACWLLAAFVYSILVEPKGETDGGESGFFIAVQRINILKSDVVFRRFIIVRAMLMSSGLAAPFFILLATQQAGYAVGTWTNLAVFLGVSGIASLLSGSFWGRFADTSSRRLMMICALLAAILCVAAAYIAYANPIKGVVLPVILFFLLSVLHQGVRLGRKTYVVDMAEGNRRTDYVAVGNTVMGILLLVFGLMSALIAQFSDVAVFLLFACSSGLAWFFSRLLPEV